MIHNSLSFVFFGTDDFSIAVLDELARAGFIPTVVVSVPDKPKGRGLALTPPPIKLWASKRSITVTQPEKLDSVFRGQLSKVNGQLFIVASYGKIIPKAVLAIPKYGALNVHPSLLPKFRGASPIQSAILTGERKTGVTIMLMDEKMDHGPVLAQKKHQESRIMNHEWPTASELEKILAREGGKLLAEVIPYWIAGKIKAVPQDGSLATYCRKFEKVDALINLSEDPYKNYLKIKAFDRSPAHAFAERNGKKIRFSIKDAEWRDGRLILTRVIPEGKKEMSYEEFLRGLR
ncbi:MAG: methionyl-tRNA formyltransferase [Candidatus Taylorbacteria bacterium]|nr:methionyl-tRNA formyltransferase [Candidatus Taylorbacteria bacterium]